MKLVLECTGDVLEEMLKALKSACPTDERVYLIFQDDLIILREVHIGIDRPICWVEIDLSDKSDSALFSKVVVKSKQHKNTIVLEAVKTQVFEALKASSALPGTQVTIRLAQENRSGSPHLYLEFRCVVPEEGENFSYEKQVDIVINKANEDIIPEIPNAIECEMVCLNHVIQIMRPLQGDDSAVILGLSLEKCQACAPRNKRDLDYLFACNHARNKVEVPEKGDLTVMSVNSSPLQVISTYYQVPLLFGQCSLKNIRATLKVKHLLELFQKSSAVNWPKVMLGIQHEGGIIMTISKHESLSLRLLAPGHIE
ncbi:unnamed protein product [Blepharisma stoltei]|uniref:Checkpoint protein n=1 Tax=Blepharisma stoltei TaxID=1481888 RepID=A0AAU9J1P7_9CILI|nr:unnamed protein product [Blepharisma stoltei]